MQKGGTLLHVKILRHYFNQILKRSILIIIIKEICTAPIFHMEWKDKALYNNFYTPTHSPTHPSTHNSRPTETKTVVQQTDRLKTVWAAWVFRAALNDEEE